MAESSPSSRTFRAVRSRTFAALGHPGFRRYYMGQGVSLVGTWLQAAAVRWLVFDQTQSEFMLGVVEVASLMPGLFVGLVAGALADRVVPLTMIVLMECGQMLLAFLLALLVGLGIVQIWQMAAILALTRICVTFELPSRQVFFYELVGRGYLAQCDRAQLGVVQRDPRARPGPGGRLPDGSGCHGLLRLERAQLPGGDRGAVIDPRGTANELRNRTPTSRSGKSWADSITCGPI